MSRSADTTRGSGSASADADAPVEAPSWVTLTDDETLLWSSNPSLHELTSAFVFGLVLVLVGASLAALLPSFNWLGVVPVLAGVLTWLVAYARHRSVRYVITSEEVYRKEGLFSRQVTNLRLDRVQNTSFDQTFVERVLGYGDVRVDTAGSGTTEIILDGVPDPGYVAGLITEQLDDEP